MAFDEQTAARVRKALARKPGITEQRMMGALVFLANGNMCCGVTGSALMVRVGPEAREGALREPHVRPMEIGGGRQPRGFVCVDPPGFASDEALKAWITRGLAFVATLPAKKP
jgi:TfoX N-terminal domain